MKYLYIACLLLSFCGSIDAQKIEFAIIVPSYNNEKYVIENLKSIFDQSYRNYTVYYYNDHSQDNTGQLARRYARERKMGKRFVLINNKKQKGALHNIYTAIHRLGPKKIVVLVDGDDMLNGQHVLRKLAKVYADKRVWLTYGSYKTSAFQCATYCDRIPLSIARKNAYRSYKWASSHLRTFYAKLFHKIRKKDLMWQGKFLPMAGDLAIMFCLLELASKKHFRYIRDILYVYNTTNPLSDFRKNPQLLARLDSVIRKKRPYKPLKYLFQKK